MSKIIFYNDTGFPFSVLTAAIRAGKLPFDRFPLKGELNSVLLACGVGSGNGRIYHFDGEGKDKSCLALWSRGHADMVKRTISSFLGIYGVCEYKIVSLRYPKTPAITAGVWLTRLPLLRGAGLSLIHHDVMGIYAELVQIARHPTLP